MLRTRIATALVLLAILLPSIFVFGPLVWGLVSLVFLAAAGFEWTALLRPGVAAPTRVAALVAILGLLWLALRHEHAPPQWIATGIYLLSALYWLVLAPHRLRAGSARGGGAALAVLLLVACWMALLDLREMGATALLAALALVWIADVFAYFVGRAIGRHRLAPVISPGKSWEGAIGGVLAVVLIGLAVARVPSLESTIPAVLASRLGWFAAAPVLILLVAGSILGDLHESLLKREAGVKDSGRTLPGHGGVLDRIDALIPTMPMVALLYRAIG